MHLSLDDQRLVGIEFSALAYNYLIKPRQQGTPQRRKRRRKDESARINASTARPDNGGWSALKLAQFLSELRNGETEREPASTERIFRNYLKLLPELAPGIELNVQSGYFQNWNTVQTQLRLCAHYFRTFVAENVLNDLPSDHNDSALRKYVYTIGALNKNTGRSDYTSALFNLVFLRFASQHRLRIRVSILNHERASAVRDEILPVSLFCDASTVMVVFLSPASGKYSAIPLSDIVQINSDLHHCFIRRAQDFEPDFMLVREYLASKNEKLICEIPIGSLVQCLNDLPDSVLLDFSDQESARVTFIGTESRLRSALMHVLPYAISISPPEMETGLRRDLEEISRKYAQSNIN